MDAKTKKILTKLGKEKVELASNIQQILKELELFKQIFIQEEDKVSKAFEKWDMAHQMWYDTLTDTDGDLDDTENDLLVLNSGQVLRLYNMKYVFQYIQE